MAKTILKAGAVVPWDIRDIMLFLILLILSMIFGRRIVIYFINILPGKWGYYSAVMFYLLCLIAFFWLLRIILKKYDNGWQLLISGSELFFGNLILSVQISLVLGVTMLILDYYITPFLFPGLFFKPSATAHFSIFLFLPIVVAPVTEEIWFRSFFFRGIMKKYGFEAGLIISTLLFSLYHYYNFGGLSIIFFSIVITIYYEKTKALYNCIFIHSMCNIIILTGSVFL